MWESVESDTYIVEEGYGGYWMEQIGPGGVFEPAPLVGFFCITIGTITPPGSLQPVKSVFDPQSISLGRLFTFW